MKIEKLTENKIRILIKDDDIKKNNIDLHALMSKAVESQGYFLEMLNEAQKQVGFNTDGCRLLIEAYSSPDNDLVFTITKYLDELSKKSRGMPYSNSAFQKKQVTVSRKVLDLTSENITYSFESFDSFCDFCEYLNYSNIPVNNIAKYISLYEYNNIYYLIFKDINEKKGFACSIFSVITEFANLIISSKLFENKLIEYGNVLFKKNALSSGIKFFSNDI